MNYPVGTKKKNSNKYKKQLNKFEYYTYTSLRLLFYQPCTHVLYMGHMQEWKINTVYPWINIKIYRHFCILNQKRLILIIEKSKRRMYSGYGTLSLQILFVYFLALPILLDPSILFSCFFILVSFLVLLLCSMQH